MKLTSYSTDTRCTGYRLHVAAPYISATYTIQHTNIYKVFTPLRTPRRSPAAAAAAAVPVEIPFCALLKALYGCFTGLCLQRLLCLSSC